MPDVEKGITITFRGNTVSLDNSIDNIGKALKVVQADTKQLNKELKLDPNNVEKLNEKMKNLTATMQLQQKALIKYKEDMLKAIKPSEQLANSAEYKKLNTQLELAEKNVASIQARMIEASKAGDNVKDPQGWQELNTKYNEAVTELDKLNDEMLDLVRTDYSVLDWDQYTVSMRKYEQTVGDLAKTQTTIISTQDRIDRNAAYVLADGYKQTGKNAQTAAKAIKAVADATKAISAVAAGALVGAVKAAADFEKGWTSVVKVIDETETTKYADLQNQIKEMAKTIPVDMDTITEAFANAGQLGVNADNVSEFVETILRLDSATNLSAGEAATTVAQLFNVIGADLGTVDQFANALVRLGNNSATTEKDILEMSATIGASAHQVGFTTQQILGLADALSGAGLNPSSAGTAISTILTKIDKLASKSKSDLYTYNKSLEQWELNNYGIMLKALANLLGFTGSTEQQLNKLKKVWTTDAAGTFEMIIDGMNKAQNKGQNLNVIMEKLGFTGIKQDSTIKALVNSYPMLTEAMGMAEDGFKNGTDAIDESEKAWQTLYSQIQLLKNNLSILGLELGNTILPIINNVVQKIIEWIQAFQGLDPETQKIVVGVLAFLAALSPFLTIITKVLGVIASINLAFGEAIIQLPTLGGLIKAVGGFFNPWVVVIGAIVGLIIAFHEEFDLLMYALLGTETWDGLKENFRQLYEFIKWILEGVYTIFKSIIGWVLEGLGKIWDFLMKIGKQNKNASGNTYDGKYDTSNLDSGLKQLTEPLHTMYSGGLGLPVMAAGGTTLTLSTSINVTNNGTPINETEIRRWGNVITDMVSDNLGKRW